MPTESKEAFGLSSWLVLVFYPPVDRTGLPQVEINLFLIATPGRTNVINSRVKTQPNKKQARRLGHNTV